MIAALRSYWRACVSSSPTVEACIMDASEAIAHGLYYAIAYKQQLQDAKIDDMPIILSDPK